MYSISFLTALLIVFLVTSWDRGWVGGVCLASITQCQMKRERKKERNHKC